MKIIRSKWLHERTITRKNEDFLDFEALILSMFDYSKEIKNSELKNEKFGFVRIEFEEKGLVVFYKSFLWFEKGNFISYERIVTQIQRELTLNKQTSNVVFGEKIVSNQKVYYIEINFNSEIIYIENSYKIDLYLDLWVKLFN